MAMGLDTSLLAALLVLLGSASVDAQKIYTFCHPQQSQIVPVTPDSENVIFRTNQHTQASPKYENCSMVLESERYAIQVAIKFRQFSLNVAKGCPKDYLCVNGVYHCGKWQKGGTFQHLLPKNSRLTVMLKTNFSNLKEPIEIEVELMTVVMGVVLEAHGDGSDRNTIYYLISQHADDMNYTDVCASDQPVKPLEKPEHFILPKDYSFCHPQQSRIVQVTPESGELVLSTDNNTQASPQYENCSLVLESGDKPVGVIIIFWNFLIDFAKSCPSEYLCIGGFYHCIRLKRYDIFYHILPERSRSTIMLKTNFSRPKNPTQLLVFLRRAVPSTLPFHAFGVGSDPLYLEYNYTRYPQPMKYTDVCASAPIDEAITTTVQPTKPTGKPTITTLAPIATTEPTGKPTITTLAPIATTEGTLTAEPGTMAQKCTCTCYCRQINEQCARNHTMIEAIVTGSTFIRRK